MAISSGLAAQIGFAEETTFGTFTTPTRFLEFNSESMEYAIERIESQGLRANNTVQRSDRWKPNTKGVSGDISLEVTSKGFGMLFENMLGTAGTPNNVSGSVYQHDFTLGDLQGKHLTIQVGKPDVGGTVRAFSYLGCKIAQWEMSCEVDGILMLNLTIDGQDETRTESLATASYPSSDELLVFTGGVVTIGGTTTHLRNISLSGDNGLATDRYFIRSSSLKKEPLQSSFTELTGSMEMEFEDLTAYERFVNGTEAEVVATFSGTEIETSYNYQVTVTLPAVRFDGGSPQVGGPEILTQPLSFKVLDDLTNEPITVQYQTTDTTP